MGTIAKGEITLSPVNDAYSVSLTNSSCAVDVDYSNSEDKNARTTITVNRGAKAVPFKCTPVPSNSTDGVEFTIYDSQNNVYGTQDGVTAEELFVDACTVVITKIPSQSSGKLEFEIETNDGYTVPVIYTYSVVRDAYSVSLTSSSCAISADYNDDEDKNARTTITVNRGAKAVPFKCTPVPSNSTDGVEFTIYDSQNNVYGTQDGVTAEELFVDACTVVITKIPSSTSAIWSGRLEFQVATEDGFSSPVIFTYSVLRDSYTVSVSNYSCILKADYSGANANLNEAKTSISVRRGITQVPFKCYIDASNTTNGVTCSIQKRDSSGNILSSDADIIDAYSCIVSLSSIPTPTDETGLSGQLGVLVETEDGYIAPVTFTYSIVREAEMLDWITEWNTNKTTIGENSIITGRLFVGRKDTLTIITQDGTASIDTSVLTGVYVGPDGIGTAGLYGYVQGKEIFHLNTEGGLIGGWTINEIGIQTVDGKLQILSEGSIIASHAGFAVWGLYANGFATFANGKVWFDAEGNAAFEGTITSSAGVIGGWTINPTQLYNGHVLIDSQYGFAVSCSTAEGSGDDPTENVGFGTFASRGGVKMYYNSTADFGLVGYALAPTGVISGVKVFTLGSTNTIAGWNFDGNSIWSGTKVNTAKQYTTESGSITIGSNGLRGYKWFIDSNGDISFMGGKIKFTAVDDGGEIAGWKLNPNRFSTNNVALVSDGSVTGLYMTANAAANFNDLASSALENFIDDHGGIYMNINDTGAEFAAYDINGKKLFKIKSDDVCSIAGWNFDKDYLYVGAAVTDTAQFAYPGEITLSPRGLIGSQWKLLADGSGKLAGDNIVWDADGKVTFSKDVSLAWETPNEVTQKIAFGNMLYRDPEFLQDVANGTTLYLEANYVTFSSGQFRDFASQFGICYKGTATLLQIDIIDTDGNTTTLWTGSTLSPFQSVQLTEGVEQITTGNETIRVKFIGQAGAISFVESIYTESGSTESQEDYICVFDNGACEGTTQDVVFATSRDYYTDTELGRENQQVVQYTCTRWYDGSYRLGGFFFANQSYKGNEFIVKIIAKIPVGFMIENYHNAYGNGGTTKWVTSQNGTGKYETYICVVKCGTEGTFSTINHFALKCANGYTPVSMNGDFSNIRIAINNESSNIGIAFLEGVKWNVSFATVYDVSSSDKVTTYIDKHGIYTGTLYAEQIVSGTISTVNIKQKDNLWFLNQDGTGAFANGNITWDVQGNTTFQGKIIATSGQIGGIEIYSDHIGVTSSATEDGGAAWAALSIYKDFIKVGGAKGYVVFGNDVIPPSAGGAFTAVGRIVNQAPNTFGVYGFDQANYGLLIDVTGGTKNYGVKSNAALMAPSFVNTEANILTFGDGGYTIDFSQHNIILMYYNNPNYSGTEVTLPTEDSVARQFGVSSLPTNFATILTFRVRTGSQKIILKGIYNHNEAQTDYTMNAGDSITVLVSKIDGFRYQILNYSA